MISGVTSYPPLLPSREPKGGGKGQSQLLLKGEDLCLYGMMEVLHIKEHDQ